MPWKMQITEFVETDAETVVAAKYFDDDDPGKLLHVESAVFPAGTSANEVRKELAKRGRSRRTQLGKLKPPPDIVGEVVAIDGI